MNESCLCLVNVLNSTK